jgi:hypothetical protein
VALHWWRLFPHRRNEDHSPAEPAEMELNVIRNDASGLAENGGDNPLSQPDGTPHGCKPACTMRFSQRDGWHHLLHLLHVRERWRFMQTGIVPCENCYDDSDNVAARLISSERPSWCLALTWQILRNERHPFQTWLPVLHPNRYWM